MAETTALDEGGQINYFRLKTAGILYNKFFQGILMDFVWGRAFIYAFFQLYLNLDGHQYNSAISVIQILWALKFVWGIVTDTIPIFKKRRIPYMVIGWVGGLIAFIFCASLEIPKTYYLVEGCHVNTSVVNNPSNVKTALPYIYAIATATCMLAIADVASDALVIEYNRREPMNIRGQTTSFAAMAESFGRLLTIVVIGFFMNGPSFDGIFCWEISVSQYFIFLICICVLGVLSASFATTEHSKVKKFSLSFLKMYMKEFWTTISGKELVKFNIFIFVYFIIFDIKSSATVKVKSKWAHVGPFANTMTNLFAKLTLVLGMYFYRKYFINTSWRKLLYIMNAFVVFVSLFFDTITIFDWIRSPYFYCAEAIINYFPFGILTVLVMQVCGEVSASKFEGITFGMYMAVWSATSPIALVLGNLISASFNVSTDERYIRDSNSDRWAVFISILLCKIINLSGFVIIYFLLTTQKKELQENLKLGIKWPMQRNIFIVVFLTSFVWIISTNIFALNPSTSCYLLFGGSGCD